MLSLLKTTIKIKKKYKFVPSKPFNPNFDGNLLAWYDGDTLSTDPANTWSDSSGNGYNLNLFNNPTLVPNAINGHDALQFDGINQWGVNNAVPFTAPITCYLVFEQITFTTGDRLISNVSAITTILAQENVTPRLYLNNGAGGILANPQVPLLTYEILTLVFDDVNCQIRTNNNIAVNGFCGNTAGVGLALANNNFGSLNCNCETAYLIVRTGVDNLATQNIFINYLKNRFAL